MVATFVVGTLVTGTVAYAAEKPNGQPFQALWDAIADLQNQIDTINLTSGPQGEQGTLTSQEFLTSYIILSGENTKLMKSVNCPSGTIATGGGYSVNKDGAPVAIPVDLALQTDFNFNVRASNPTPDDLNVNVRVYCTSLG